MKCFRKQHYTTFFTLNAKSTARFSSRQAEILHLCRSGSLLKAIQLLNTIDPSEINNKPLLFASLLQTCTKVRSHDHGLQVHARVLKSGLETDRFVGNSLLALYFKLGADFRETERVFDGLFFKDVISWTSMISGYVQMGRPHDSLELFLSMVEFGVEPNAFTLSAVIKACSEIGDLSSGRCFHGDVFKRGFDTNVVICSALIDMYGRNDVLKDACLLFDELPEPDSICWTSVISAFTRNDYYEEALGFFFLMQRRTNHGLRLDGFTFGSVLTACGNLGRRRQGKEIHGKVVTAGISCNVIVDSSLVDMYGKCGALDESRRVFDRMIWKNSVSWCALLGAYCQSGSYGTVIKLFRMMGAIDLYAFGTVLRACAGLSAIRQGKETHCHYLRKGGWRDVIVESALVDLYAKCGSIDHACRIFARMRVRNRITWNSMICGFAQNGRGEEAVETFNEMVEKRRMPPDYISFIGVLFACSHAGLVDQGREYFRRMTEECCIRAGLEHYSCMIDLLGRAGLVEEAEILLESADCRDDSSLWEALLGACSVSRNSVVTIERIAKRVMELKPDHHLSYVLLANVYKAAGQWDDALKVRKLMDDRGVKKMAGRSWIEAKNDLGSQTV